MFQCVGNRGSINEPFVAGIWLSVKRGLVFSGSSLDDKSSEAYGCLYGVVINAAGAAETPIVPYGVALLGIAQAILSAALVFLLLLGIRNQFRIR